MTAARLKILVIVLSVLVAAQAIWIISSSLPDSPGTTETTPPEVREVKLLTEGAGFEITLTEPLNLDEVQEDVPATIDPETKGTWVWTNPYQIRFNADSPLVSGTEYMVTLAQDLGVTGETSFTLQTDAFKITRIDLNEASGDTPGTSAIAAKVWFNGPVAPEDLLDHATLIDEASGETIPVQVTTAWSGRQLKLRSEGIKKTPEKKTYKLTVTKGLPRAGSDKILARDSSDTVSLQLNPVLALNGISARSGMHKNTITLNFSTPMDPETAGQYITVEPKTTYLLSADGSQLLLTGDFKPGENYTLTARQGLIAADGAELDKDVTRPVFMHDLEPSADFVGTGMFLPIASKAGLAIKAINTDKVTVRVDRVYPNNLFTLFTDHGWRVFDSSWTNRGVPHNLGGKIFEETIAIPNTKNQSVHVALQMAGQFKPGDKGLFKVSLSADSQRDTKRWVLLTDIGLVAKREKGAFRVWAISNTTLKPLANVQIKLISNKNQQIGHARTDANGAARLPLTPDTPDGTPYMLLAERGNDFTFLLPARFGVDTTGLDVSGATPSKAGLKGFIYGERDLYRPGETLKGMVVVRKNNLAAPSAMPLTLIQRDPKGREIRKMRIKADARGQAGFDIPIPDYALTGGHSLTLSAGKTVIGSYEFKVEEFIPDRIKVEIETPEDTFTPGQSMAVEVKSSYLFGPPAANLPVTARALLRPAPFVAKGLEGFVFGNPDREFKQQEIFSKDATLDAAGNGNFTMPIPSGLRPPAALEAVIYGRVSETGGRGVTARKSVMVHPYDYYLGFKKLEQYGYEYGQPLSFTFAAADTDGKPCAYGELKAQLYRDRWRTVVRIAPSGEYQYESVNDPKLVAETTLTAGRTKGNVDFTPPDYGSYRVVLSAPNGASTSTSFYCGGWGYSPWALENPAKIDLVMDKEQYKPGETAVIQVRAPFSGRMLVTVEGQSINDTRVIDLKGNTGEVRFPVKKVYAPNVHVTAILVRKASDVPEGSVARAFGAVPLLVDNLSNKMDIAVSGPEEVRPETELNVEVDARPGAVVTIAAVDEGIMQLSGADDPDPFDFFYARRALRVKTSDTFIMLYPDLARIMNASDAGGGAAMKAESQFMRTEGIRRVKPVSFWSGPLTAGADGKVRYSMQLPDFQGALRIVAVGLDGKKFGTARSMTRVRSPLAVTPTLPRFLANGDTIDMPVAVRNDLGKAAPITVQVLTEGLVESTADPVTLELENGQEKTVYMPLAAKSGAGGAAKVIVRASGGDEMRRVVTDLPVRPALPMRREIAYGMLSGTGGQMVPATENYVPGTVTRTIALSQLPLTRFTGKLEYLLRYPYGCAEQTTSKAFPLIRFGDLAKALAPSLVDKRGHAFMVQAAIMRLANMQTGNGGFAYWPGGDRPDPWVSAYVTHFLLEASQAGFSVQGLLNPALDYMNSLINRRIDNQAVKAYALFNLAKAGRPDRGSMDEMRDKHLRSHTAAGRTLLACAYAMAGDMQSFNLILTKLPSLPKGRQPGGGMGSGLRDAALMLLALTDTNPDDNLVFKLTDTVSGLMEATRWGTTQENGLAFAALGKVFAKAKPGPFSGSLETADEAFPFTDITMFNKNGISTDGPVSLTLSSDNATAYWSVTTRGVPTTDSVVPVSNGLEVQRTFLDRNGKPLDITKLEQGTLVIMRTAIRRTNMSVENVVLQLLLPAGLEVENARLATTEVAVFKSKNERPIKGHQDLRDDRILFFTDLYTNAWHVGYTQLRAVTPGTYGLPPVQAEAMYDPSIVFGGTPATMTVTTKE